MHSFDLRAEERFDPARHVETILGKMGEGDVTVACWEPGQCSPYHAHPHATEIYFCFEGGGKMHTPAETIDIKPGCFVVHPPGELHEYENGAARTLLFRVRYGSDFETRIVKWRGQPDWKQTPEDVAYFRENRVA